jgi:hypothetical protein
MKVTQIDHGGKWTEELWEPGDPASGKVNGDANGQSTAQAGAQPNPQPGAVQPNPTDWPTLSPAAYHGLAGKVVDAILPSTESDPVALLVQYLASFGNALGRHPFYLVEGAQHFAILFALLVGPTAKARKGTSAQRVRAIFEKADPDWVKSCVANGISSGEGIIHAIRDPVFSLNKKTGAQELTDVGVVDKRLFLDEREFSSALDNTRREGNVVERVLREAWDCPSKPLRTLTKHSPTQATYPHISIIGHITVDELRSKLSERSMTNGFGNRFLFVCIRRSKRLPHGGNLDTNIVDRLAVETHDALLAAQQRDRIFMTPEAEQRWSALYDALTDDKPGLFGALTARAEAQTIRLAMIYALLDQAPAIDIIHLEAALALWAYCEDSTRYIFKEMTGDPVADTILQALRKNTTGLSRSEIYAMLGFNTSAARIQQALGTLAGLGKARSVKGASGTRGGRPSETWFAI